MPSLARCNDCLNEIKRDLRSYIRTVMRVAVLATLVLGALACSASEVEVTRVVELEVTREVEISVEVIREVEVPVEVIREVEVPVEIMREVEVSREIQVPIEVTREIEVPVEITREMEVTREVEVTRIVPLEVTKVVEVPLEVTREVEVPVEVTREVEVTRIVVVTATPTPSPTPTPIPEPPSTPAELVERVQDSIVRVQARTGGAFFGRTRAGSGFIFAVEGTTAFIATNHHIIDDSNSVEVQIGASSTYDALVLGWDAERDVAVVSICCSFNFKALQWGDATPSETETVIAIGYPDNDTGNLIATIGEVRAPDDLSMEHDFIPHSAPLNPGNSGGPLFSMPGADVVGINTAGGTESLAFYAVPYQAIEDQVEEWRSQLVIVPVPTPTPVIPFATIGGEDFAYTVNEIRDPAQSSREVKTGNRLVAIDVSLVALVDDVSYNIGFFALQDEDGYVWDDYTRPDIEPGLSYGDLSSGQKVRGWIGFEVPQSAVLTGVFYDELGSSGRVLIADLTSE